MSNVERAGQVAGTWLAIASFLIIVTLLLHGPISPDLADQMGRIVDGQTRWVVAHWFAAPSLSLYAVAGLVVLTSGSRLTETWWTLTAWAVVPVGSIWTLTTAVAEATAVTEAAVSGNIEAFEAWWMFAEGKANGFAFVGLSVAVIARNEARSAMPATPAWSAWIAAVAAVASFFGWALGMWLNVGIGSLIWVVSSVLMSLWTLWFGIELTRSGSRLETNGRVHA